MRYLNTILRLSITITGMRQSKKRNIRRKTRKQNKKQRGGQATPTFSFMSYGNDKFKESKERIRKEAEEMGCFNGQIKIYSPDDLSADFKSAVGDVLNEKRGGGYMTWKGYVISDTLSKMKDNDILLYADAGCTLQSAGVSRLKEYMKMIAQDTGKCVLVMRLRDQLAKKWTTNEIMNYFGVKMDDPIFNKNQILSGFVMCRKCPESVEVIGKWLDVAKKRPDLFTDRYNDDSKKLNPDFIENRHDQTILSMIVDTEPFNKNCVVMEEEIERTSEPVRPEEYFKDKPIVASRKRI